MNKEASPGWTREQNIGLENIKTFQWAFLSSINKLSSIFFPPQRRNKMGLESNDLVTDLSLPNVPISVLKERGSAA